MGIYDRDYIRDRNAGRRFRPDAPPPVRGLRSGLRFGWSATSWLIIINIAVFVLDAALWAGGISIEVGYGAMAPSGDRISGSYVVDKSQVRLLGYDLYESPVYRPGGTEAIGIYRYRDMPPLRGVGHFSTSKALADIEVWRFITYAFLHADIMHIAFNMMGLFFFGPLVERHLGSRRLYLSFYFVCAIAGSFLYLILNLLGYSLGAVPGLLSHNPTVPLIGASAAVFGVLMACAKIAGDEEMLLFAFVPVKIRHGAWGLTIISFLYLMMGHSNAGGHAAHLGGAVAGWYFIRNPKHLLDFFDDFLSRAPTPGLPGQAAAKKQRMGHARPPTKQEQRLDEILAKVSRDGLHALTDEEREFLNQQSERAQDDK